MMPCEGLHTPVCCGRFVVVCGDGEYIVYTAMALRNKTFGQAQEFVWSHDSSQYAIREGSSTVQIFKNFKEQKSFKPDFGAEGRCWNLCQDGDHFMVSLQVLYWSSHITASPLLTEFSHFFDAYPPSRMGI